MALPGGNGVMSLIGCRVGHACPWAPSVEISPNRTSARKELRRITFSSGRRATFRLVRADYVAEAGSTQTSENAGRGTGPALHEGWRTEICSAVGAARAVGTMLDG